MSRYGRLVVNAVRGLHDMFTDKLSDRMTSESLTVDFVVWAITHGSVPFVQMWSLNGLALPDRLMQVRCARRPAVL